MLRILFAAVLLVFTGCASVPPGSTEWRGHTSGQVKARIVTSSDVLPANAWIEKSDEEHADGHVSYTRWGVAGFRRKEDAYFRVQEKLSAEMEPLGRFESRDTGTAFCVMNPQHGMIAEGDTIAITHEYDYCARLVRNERHHAHVPR